ncbi:10027_t:CDS:2 [Cetraspora pellucida]|uniref:10027_t:CDS:1 n=1 Tax=Cetraspora pellucida TaxID=1433469 RepID=A0A9N9B8U0_9GLOM|nr:10027_t:CDS:2 [Cetraspora pellucida]
MRNNDRASDLIYLIDIHSLQYLSQKLNLELRNLVILIVIDKKNRRLPKPFNNCPGYNLKYVESYINKYCGINNYQQFFDELFETERRYDILSVIKPYETPIQWAIWVRVPLQELVSERKRSDYHTHALFLAFGKVNDEKPKKIYANAIYRYIERLEPADLMKQHWDYSYSKAKTRDGLLSLLNNNTLKEEKFLGLIPHKVKNPISLDQIKMCLNKEYGEYIKKYNRLPYIAEFEISRY